MELNCKRVLAILAKAKASIQIAETYFFSKGFVELAVFTDHSYRCKRLKIKEPLSTSDVLAEFHLSATQFSSSCKKVCCSYVRKTRNVITCDDIEAMAIRPRTLNFSCLQAYVEPWSEATQALGLAITLEDNAYAYAYSPADEVKTLTGLQLQQKMMKVAKAVILCIQECEKKRIEALELEFIQDSQKRLWLVNVGLCRLAVKATMKQVSISRSVISYEDAIDPGALPISMQRSLSQAADILTPDCTPQHRTQQSTSSLPLVCKVYKQLQEKASPRTHKLRHKRASASPVYLKDQVIKPLASFMSRSIQLTEASEGSPIVSSAFKDLLSRYVGKEHSRDLLAFPTEDSDLCPAKNFSTSLIEPFDPISSNLIPISQATSPKMSVQNRRTKSSTLIPANFNHKPKATLYEADSATIHLNKVVARLQTRRQELSRKYGSPPPLPKVPITTSLKPATLSPYSSVGFKIKH